MARATTFVLSHHFSFLVASVQRKCHPLWLLHSFQAGANAGCTHWFLAAANREGNAGLQCKLLLIKLAHKLEAVTLAPAASVGGKKAPRHFCVKGESTLNSHLRPE